MKFTAFSNEIFPIADAKENHLKKSLQYFTIPNKLASSAKKEEKRLPWKK